MGWSCRQNGKLEAGCLRIQKYSAARPEFGGSEGISSLSLAPFLPDCLRIQKYSAAQMNLAAVKGLARFRSLPDFLAVCEYKSIPLRGIFLVLCVRL
jgi:hypothetical protein